MVRPGRRLVITSFSSNWKSGNLFHKSVPETSDRSKVSGTPDVLDVYVLAFVIMGPVLPVVNSSFKLLKSIGSRGGRSWLGSILYGFFFPFFLGTWRIFGALQA